MAKINYKQQHPSLDLGCGLAAGFAAGLADGGLGHVIIGVEGVHVVFLGVEVVEDHVEDKTADEGSTG